MIESGKFSEFNETRVRNISECNDEDIKRVISENEEIFPLIYKLLTETTRFYTEHFSELLQYIKREKRLVVFETPSRVSLTHEYTVEGAGSLKSGFHFLFNTRERLNWLKIELEGRRVSIASKSIVKKLLEKKLGDEVSRLSSALSVDTATLLERIYNSSDGKPCFVEFNEKEQKGQQSLLFCVTFFDSIREKKTKQYEGWWSPLQEKELVYNYSTISGNANAWIYFKAPANFVINTEHNAESGMFESSLSSDEEIRSLVLTPHGGPISVDFTIRVLVPNALKIWYNVMLYVAIMLIVVGLGGICYSYFAPLASKFVDTFINSVYAIIAALIATRGWLMSEEQVMKKMSNWYTWLIIVMIGVVLSMSIVPINNKDKDTSQISETVVCTQNEKKNDDNVVNNSDVTNNIPTISKQDSSKFMSVRNCEEKAIKGTDSNKSIIGSK